MVIIAKSGALLPNDGDFDYRPVLENKEDANFGVMADSSFRDEIEDSKRTHSRRLRRLELSVSRRSVTTEVVNAFISDGEKAMVIGCGSETFMIDLGNAVANAVASARKPMISSCWRGIGMYLETFGGEASMVVVIPRQSSLKGTTTPE